MSGIDEKRPVPKAQSGETQPFPATEADMELKPDVKQHGLQSALKRAGQPEEPAPAYVYFASGESSYTTSALLEIHGASQK
jgi:NAD(P)-dependent dehydrogenase (short-subunit alcohol dehydrogenase family)